MGTDYRKILIIQLQPIGDILRATPVVAKLKEQYPESHIAFLVYDRYAELLSGNPNLNEIIPFRRRTFEEIENTRIGQIFNELTEFINGLKQREFDLVINLHNTTLSAILAYLIRARETKGVTLNAFGHLSVPQGWLFTPRDYYKSGLNMVEVYLRNVGLNADGARLEIYLEDNDLIFREEFLRREGIDKGNLLIGLAPGAGVYSKKWPKERFAEVGDRLAKEYGARIILFGGKGDTELANEIIDLMDASPLNLVGKTSLKESAALIQRCNLFLTNDSGPMHMAVALKTPTVAIFGSSSLRLNSPWGNGYIALQADLDCTPCRKSYCEELKCLKSITVEKVLSSCRRLLARN